MKKLLSTIAILGSLIASSQAATVSVVGGIDPIVIGPVFSVDIVSVRTRPAFAGDPSATPPLPAISFDQDFASALPGNLDTGAAVVNGNLYFGTVNMLPGGIYVNASPTAATGLYSGTAHRAGGLYTETRMYMNNNSNNNFFVSLTVSGTLIGLTPPSTLAAEGNSVMHTSSAPLVALDNANALTAFPTNIQSNGLMKAVPNGTPCTMYTTTSLTSPISDAFKTLTFLDFLPIVIPAGTYGGTSTWSVVSF